MYIYIYMYTFLPETEGVRYSNNPHNYRCGIKQCAKHKLLITF